MPDPEPNPPETPNDRAREHADEAEIERVLAEAAQLTDRLEAEVGALDHEPGSLGDLGSYETPSVAARAVDDLDQVQAELRKIAHGAGATGDQEVPPSSSRPPDVTEPGSTVLGDDDRKREGDYVGHTLPIDTCRRQPETGGSSPGRGAIAIHRHVATAGVLLASACRSVQRTGAVILDRFLNALDALDGRLAFVSYDARRAVGWVAAALFAAAVAIAAFSLQPWSP